MINVKHEITKEEFDKAKEKGAGVLVPEYVHYGYGLYGCRVWEEGGKYYLEWRQGESCE
jgi:hypothetical protein